MGHPSVHKVIFQLEAIRVSPGNLNKRFVPFSKPVLKDNSRRGPYQVGRESSKTSTISLRRADSVAI